MASRRCPINPSAENISLYNGGIVNNAIDIATGATWVAMFLLSVAGAITFAVGVTLMRMGRVGLRRSPYPRSNSWALLHWSAFLLGASFLLCVSAFSAWLLS